MLSTREPSGSVLKPENALCQGSLYPLNTTATKARSPENEPNMLVAAWCPSPTWSLKMQTVSGNAIHCSLAIPPPVPPSSRVAAILGTDGVGSQVPHLANNEPYKCIEPFGTSEMQRMILRKCSCWFLGEGEACLNRHTSTRKYIIR